MDEPWRIELLGGLRLSRNERVITHFRTRKTGVLLAYLAYRSDRPHPRAALVELLWPDVSFEDGRNSLNQSLSSLRRMLDPAGPAETGPGGDPAEPSGSAPTDGLLVADRTTVRLNAQNFTTDVAQFAAALQAASQTADRALRASCLVQAVELYRGELLPGCFEPWVLQERLWLAEQYFQVLGQLLVDLEGENDLRAALHYARRGVSMDPLREEAHRDLIRLYTTAGQPAAALRQHRELERMLEQEMIGSPEPDTRAPVRDIVCLASGRSDSSGGRRLIGTVDDPPLASLATPYRVPAFASTSGGGPGSAPARSGLGERPPVEGVVPVGSMFYLARSTDASLHAAIERRDSIVQIEAAPRMGKSSLLAHGLQRAREAGSRVAWTDLHLLAEADLRSVDRLFLTLAEWLADQLDLDVLPHHLYNPHLGPSVNFERYLRREVLEKSAAPLVWGLDEADPIFASECGDQVLALFCAWHNRRGLDPAGPWGRLTLVMTFTTDARPRTSGMDRFPLRIGTRLTLSGFSVEEVADLNRRYDSPLASPAEVARFHHRMGGHPYRVSRGLWDLASRGMGLDAFMAQTEPDAAPRRCRDVAA